MSVQLKLGPSRGMDVVARENGKFSQFRSMVLGRYHRSKTSLTPSEWIAKHTRHNGIPFSFLHHEYQIMPVNDMSRDMTTEKPAQVGWTEILLRMAIFYCTNYQGFSCIFTQPSQSDVNRFSKSRVNDVLRDCPDVEALNAGLKGQLDSAEIKKIGRSYLYLRGTFGTRAAISVPSDMNIYDEKNFSNPLVTNQYKSRLQHSRWGLERNISTPTIPRFGVSALYDNSDRKRMVCRCTHCGKHQVITWPVNIFVRFEIGGIWRPLADDDVRELAIQNRMVGKHCEADFRCVSCFGSLDRSARNMEWVAERPGAQNWAGGVSGYSMSQMDVVFKKAWDIICASDVRLGGYRRWSDFVNFVLGNANLDEHDGITDEQFDAACDISVAQTTQSAGTLMGVDVGKVCHIQIIKPMKNVDALIWAETVSADVLKTRVRELVRSFRPYCMVFDAEPYESTINEIIAQYPKIAWKARYGTSNYKINELTGEVGVPRTVALDEVYDGIRNRRISILAKGRPENVYGDTLHDGLKQHLQNMAKVLEEDEDTGDKEFNYVKLGPDHWVHSLAYANVGHHVLELLHRKETQRVSDVGISGAKIK